MARVDYSYLIGMEINGWVGEALVKKSRHTNLLFRCKNCSAEKLYQCYFIGRTTPTKCKCRRSKEAQKLSINLRAKTRNSWHAMRYRCLNPKGKHYKSYGGRGITIDPAWLCFENFLADMGDVPSPDLSIDRIDNDKGYYKENCRWATDEEQRDNRRSGVILEYDGKRMSQTKWSKLMGIPVSRIATRLQKKLPIEEVLQEYVAMCAIAMCAKK